MYLSGNNYLVTDKLYFDNEDRLGYYSVVANKTGALRCDGEIIGYIGKNGNSFIMKTKPSMILKVGHVINVQYSEIQNEFMIHNTNSTQFGIVDKEILDCWIKFQWLYLLPHLVHEYGLV